MLFISDGLLLEKIPRLGPVLPGSDKLSRLHSPKTLANFRSFQGHLSKNLPLHDISKLNDNKKQKQNIWGGIL
jgi:hypothetical protein